MVRSRQWWLHGDLDEIEKMEKKLKDMVRLGFCWISTQVTPMVRFLLDLDASSPDKYLTRGQWLFPSKRWKHVLFKENAFINLFSGGRRGSHERHFRHDGVCRVKMDLREVEQAFSGRSRKGQDHRWEGQEGGEWQGHLGFNSEFSGSSPLNWNWILDLIQMLLSNKAFETACAEAVQDQTKN